MATGTVKWFSNAKGYGFISPDGGAGDVFAHFSAIAMEGYRTLRRGQKVKFDLTEGPKGLLAANIFVTAEADGAAILEHMTPGGMGMDVMGNSLQP